MIQIARYFFEVKIGEIASNLYHKISYLPIFFMVLYRNAAIQYLSLKNQFQNPHRFQLLPDLKKSILHRYPVQNDKR